MAFKLNYCFSQSDIILWVAIFYVLSYTIYIYDFRKKIRDPDKFGCVCFKLLLVQNI